MLMVKFTFRISTLAIAITWLKHMQSCVEKKNQIDVTEWFIALIICSQHVSGTSMPIIRSSSLYVCYYRLWCAMPWLLVVGGHVQGSRLCVQEEGCCTTLRVVQHLAFIIRIHHDARSSESQYATI